MSRQTQPFFGWDLTFTMVTWEIVRKLWENQLKLCLKTEECLPVLQTNSSSAAWKFFWNSSYAYMTQKPREGKGKSVACDFLLLFLNAEGCFQCHVPWIYTNHRRQSCRLPCVDVTQVPSLPHKCMFGDCSTLLANCLLHSPSSITPGKIQNNQLIMYQKLYAKEYNKA